MTARSRSEPQKKGRGGRRRRAPRPSLLSATRDKHSTRSRYASPIGAGVLLVALLVGPLLGWAHAKGPGGGKPVVIDFPAGLSTREVSDLLEREGLVKSPWLMNFYLWFSRSAAEIRAGPHVLNDGLSPDSLVARLEGRASRGSVRVTIPEGWNHLQIAGRLQERQACSQRGFLEVVRNPQLLAELAIPAETAEGYLFPATYTLLADSEPSAVVRVMVQEFRRRMDKIERAYPGVLQALRADRGWGEHQIIILASIVEKETARPEERGLIAGVLTNRLTKPEFEPRGRLQSDPTAAYGCAIGALALASCSGFNGRVTPAMVRDLANPYNTYRHSGLPPGPIANPGEGALAAALAPSTTDYLFFVANGDGGHTFSRSYQEHQQAIQATR